VDARGSRGREGGNTEVINLSPNAPHGVITVDALDSALGCFVTPGDYVALIESFKNDGFEQLSDLCGVDYLGYESRPLPEGVTATRFEVVVNLLSMSKRQRVRIRVQAGNERPEVDSLFALYPGAEALEREAFDMFGILFRNHPDLTRILMPEEWEGHPLRKDYGVGRVPVQFKETPGPR
jgi:NADH-quinone oxidoreductase subunit C